MAHKRPSDKSEEGESSKRAKRNLSGDNDNIPEETSNTLYNGEINEINEELSTVEEDVTPSVIVDTNNTKQLDSNEIEGGSVIEMEAQKESDSEMNIKNTTKQSKSQKKKKKCKYGDCKEEFSDEEALIQHMCTHIKQKRFKCPVKDCPVVKFSKLEINEHFKTHNTAKIPCPIEGCNKSFSFQLELRKHLVRHNRQESDEESQEFDNYDCPFTGCEKTFKSEKALKKHIEIHKKNMQKKKSYYVCCS